MSGWTEIAEWVFVRRYESYTQNVGLVVGDQRCLVIDTGTSLREGTDVARAVREVTALPWVVVNTHAHFDHYLGNAAFSPAEIWACARCADTIGHTGAQERSATEAYLRASGRRDEADDIAATPIEVPTHTFAGESQVLDLGGRQAELGYLGRGHTDTDIVIDIADASIIFAGDLVEQGGPPQFGDAYPLDWPETLDALLARGLDGAVVPGHGDVVDRAFVHEQRALLAHVIDICREDGDGALRQGWQRTGLPEREARMAVARCRQQLLGALR